MTNNLTRYRIEKAIKKWRDKNPVQVETCHINRHCDCLACQLDSALADYERADDRLSKLYFQALAEIK
jgi:hypothetical protein